MFKIIQLYSNPSEDLIQKWNDYVDCHSNGNFFQTFSYFQFLLNQRFIKPFALMVIDSSNKICGLLVGSIQVFGPKFFSNFSKRIIIYGGPLLNLNDEIKILKIILSELNSIKSIYVEFRNLYQLQKFKQIFNDYGFHFQDHLNYLVEINDYSLSNIKSDKSRQIKKALKNGAFVEEAKGIEQVNELYNILYQLYKTKVKKPLPPLDHFQKLFINLNNQNKSKIFVVTFDKKVIGGIFCFIFKNSVIYEYYVCGMDFQYKDLYPSVLATYAPIKYAVENGFKYFDFLGAGKPTQDYGVRKFKSRFGGIEVNYGRYMKINSKLFYIYRFVFDFYASTKKN